MRVEGADDGHKKRLMLRRQLLATHRLAATLEAKRQGQRGGRRYALAAGSNDSPCCPSFGTTRRGVTSVKQRDPKDYCFRDVRARRACLLSGFFPGSGTTHISNQSLVLALLTICPFISRSGMTGRGSATGTSSRLLLPNTSALFYFSQQHTQRFLSLLTVQVELALEGRELVVTVKEWHDSLDVLLVVGDVEALAILVPRYYLRVRLAEDLVELPRAAHSIIRVFYLCNER